MSLASQISAGFTAVGNYIRDSVLTRVLPTGGTSGQVLTKDTATNFDVSWQTPSGGGGSGNIDGGNASAVSTSDIDGGFA